MSDEQQLRERICEIGRRMYNKGHVAANDGNISCRLEPGRFLCTPTGVSKGFMDPEDLAVVDDDGNQLDGPIPRTSEVLLHMTIYRHRPDVGAVAHCHAPYATAFAMSGQEIPTGIMPEMEVQLGPVPTIGYDSPGSPRLSEAILPHLRNHANTILLANHGPVGFDKTLDLAFFHLETIDMCCRQLLLLKQVGSVQRISEAKMHDLLEAKKRMGIPDPRHEGRDPYPSAQSNEYLDWFVQRGKFRIAPDTES